MRPPYAEQPMNGFSSILTALGVEHIHLAYHYVDADDLDGYSSLLDATVQVNIPDLFQARTRHEPRKFLAVGRRVVVLGKVHTEGPTMAVEFADVFTLSNEALILRQHRYLFAGNISSQKEESVR
ncbi:hypothetical protein [Spongiactinospora sp. 9N601]|uniref:hypothetical protein n=1 Tax=Spongiactinospora sp. 9N601 TaxID=3375149 RepID=UPI0037A29F43